MNKEQEIQFYWNLMQAIEALHRGGATVQNDNLFAELIDELEVLDIHVGSLVVKRLVARALRRFGSAQSAAAPGAA